MSAKNGRWLRLGALVLLIVLAYFQLRDFTTAIQKEEPDLYYELSLARQTAESGIVRKIPQVEGLHWDKEYIDKNFLFTVLIGIGYKIGGEKGALFVGALLGILFLMSVLFLIYPFNESIWSSAFVMAVFLTTALLVNRVVLLRPHLLGMIAFVWILKGIVSRRPAIAAAGGVLFSSGYHMLALPIALLLLGAFFELRYGKKWTKSLWWAAAGLVVGLILNPYFPKNLTTETNTWQIALNSAGVDTFNRAAEMAPPVAKYFIRAYAFYLSVLLLSLLELSGFLGAKAKSVAKSSRRVQFFLTLAGICFFGLSTFNPRALEYALPLGIVCLAVLISRWRDWKPAPWVLGGAVLVFHLPLCWLLFAHPYHPPTVNQNISEAIRAIPRSGENRVFNCEWYTTPIVLYERPDLHFLDISDPMLYLEANATAYEMREKMKQGQVAYPYGLIHNAYRSNYVLCENPAFSAQLETDPHFSRLYPDKFPRTLSWGIPFVYQVRENPIPNLLFDYEVSPASANSETPPGPKTHWDAVIFPEQKFFRPNQRSPYIDLFRWLGKDPAASREIAKAGDECLWIRPKRTALEEFKGSDWLAIGGGPGIKLWLNGKRFYFQPGDTNSVPRMFHTFVPLPRKISSSDKIEALVCAQKTTDYFGFGLSFWRRNEINAFCKAKEKGDGEITFDKETGKWPFWGENQRTCLGLTASAQTI